MSWLRGVVCLLAVGACSVEIEVPPDDPPLPRFTFDTDVVTGIVKQPTTVVVKLTYADGTPASNYEFFPVTSCGPTGLCEVSSRSIGPGEEEITITSVQDGYFKLEPYVRVFNVDGHVTRNFTAPAIHLSFASDEPESFAMLNRGATMVVGEKRAVTMGTYNRYHLSGLPLTYSITDTSIATVDADGVVTGLAEGETTLRITAGASGSRTIEVHVGPGVVGPPADNVIHRMDEDGRYTSLPQPAHWRPASPLPNHTLVVDSRGSPHLVFKVGEQAGVASWSGTGFGFELFPERFEGALAASITIDETDHLYAVAFTRIGTYVVYDKHVLAPPSAWRRRKLDIQWGPSDRVDQSITDYAGASLEKPEISLIPRSGGGVWVGYKVVVNGQNFLGYGCADLLRLAEITDEGIATHHVRETWAMWGSECEHASPRSAVVLLVPSTVGLPTVIDGNQQYSYDGAHWTAAPFAPPTSFGDASTGQEVEYPLVAPPANGMPLPVVAKATVASNARSLFMLQGRDHLYFGNDSIASFGRYTYGVLVDDGFANAFIDEPLLQTELPLRAFGITSSGDRIHAVTDIEVTGTSIPQQLMYLQRRVPGPDTRSTDPETSGRRIEDSLYTQLLQAPPVFQADSTRVFVTRTYMNGSGAPAFLVNAPGTTTWERRETGGGARNVWAVGDELFAFTASQALIKSTDRAQTFTQLAAGAGLTWYAEGVFASGIAHVYNTALGQRIRLAANVPDQTSVTFTEVTLGAALSMRAHESGHVLLEGPAGIYHLAAIENGVPADSLLLRQYSTVGAVTLERAFALPALGANDELMVKTAVVTAAGSIAVLSRTTASVVTVHLLNPTTGAVQSASLGNYGGRPARLVRLPDGTIALVGSQSTRTLHGASGRSQQWHVTARTSSDGLTFSAPTELRPDGGDLQYVFGVSATPAGDLLMGLMDNANLSGDATLALFPPYHEFIAMPQVMPTANIFLAEVP